VAKLQRKAVKLGLERALEASEPGFKNQRVGLICNQASLNHNYDHAADLLFNDSNIKLTALFGPQHGIRGDVQDNMIETAHALDKTTNLPIYSLYSETREPTEEMLRDLDTIVFDLQDVGGRVYTFIYTMANAMKACAKYGKKMVVCDRPNPINGIDIEGNFLEVEYTSFVGQYPIPMRHGLTVGELAKFFNEEYEIGCDLTVIPMENWSREDFFDETDVPWAMPSPNMPTVDTAIIFPATVYFEGTQISEGRGTTRPFEIVGAPFIESNELAEALTDLQLPGVKFCATNFIPTFQKHAGTSCGGVFIHVADRTVYQPVITGIAMIKTIYDLYKDDFKWKDPPYEYVYDKNPFDVISGTDKIRKFIENGADVETIKLYWANDVKSFREQREKYLLY
jgi:beta-N-acetylhexosaminidase